MKKAFFFIVFLPFLYGCSTPPTANEQIEVLGVKEINTKGAGTYTVKKLQEDYKKETGMILVAPEALYCRWDAYCYYKAWYSVYEKGISDFKSKKIAEEKLAESKCMADPECKRQKDILDARKGLSWGYSMLLGINPYHQADADYMVRSVCEKTTSAQKEGVSRDVLVNRMRDLPGIAPRERGILKDIVKSCWDISSLSGDWRAAIRQ